MMNELEKLARTIDVNIELLKENIDPQFRAVVIKRLDKLTLEYLNLTSE